MNQNSSESSPITQLPEWWYEGRLREALAKLGYIAILWHTDHVGSVRPDLTETQCWQVLERCESQHETCIGLDNDLIRIHAEELFPQYGGGEP